MQADHASIGAKFLLTGTAPGLICFLFSFAIIVAGILHRSELKIGEVQFAPSFLPSESVMVPENPVGAKFDFGVNGDLSPKEKGVIK